MTDRFRNEKGRLTLYAFACGYAEIEHAGPLTVKLSQPSPGVYSFVVDNWDNAEAKWQGCSTHETLTSARRAYQQRVREMPLVLMARALEL